MGVKTVNKLGFSLVKGAVFGCEEAVLARRKSGDLLVGESFSQIVGSFFRREIHRIF